ncbi:hypothetical protein LPJ56_000619 [Coemansia sp. RSA 2599]|nr:hypothetical protein LPJ75_000235 [Coemansia sp. RSA 2598]KAJ1829110.1 hypothetical protein LPJ56_000619 [Coemansia sp. RSA 2599]
MAVSVEGAGAAQTHKAVANSLTEDFIRFNSSDEEERDSDTENNDEQQRSTSLAGAKRKADGDAETDADASADTSAVYEKCYNGHPVPAWLKGHKRLGSGAHPAISDMLNEEVTRFVDYISPTPEEHQMRQWVIERLQRVLDRMNIADIDAKALCFGSFNTRLYLPTSDIDMTVMLYEKGTKTVSLKYESKQAISRFLYTLARELKKDGFCTSCEVIAKARVPIIKTRESITNFHIDVSVNAESGFNSARVQKSFCENVYPDALRPLILIIKHFLAQRSMNEVYTGGMGSYAISLLAISLLQMHPRIMSGGLEVSKNLGVLLVEFFELYGKRFNYDRVCVSVRERGQYLDKRSIGFVNHQQPFLLSIEDPCDTTNDVTRGTYGISRIRQTFSGAYDLISNSIFAYHQTRKYGEPINDALRALAASQDGKSSARDRHGPKRKRAKGSNGKAVDKKETVSFDDDPWAPVSFLSSIISVRPAVVAERAKVVKTFYAGTMQKLLGVEYKPDLLGALMPAASPEPSKAAVYVADYGDDDDSDSEDREDGECKSPSAREQISRMRFDFAAKESAHDAIEVHSDAYSVEDGEEHDGYEISDDDHVVYQISDDDDDGDDL